MNKENIITALSVALNPHRLIWSLHGSDDKGQIILGDDDLYQVKVEFELVKGALSDCLRYRSVHSPHNPQMSVQPSDWVTGVTHDPRFTLKMTRDILDGMASVMDVEEGLDKFDRAWSVVSASKTVAKQNVYVHREIVEGCTTRYILKHNHGDKYEIVRVSPDSSETQLFNGTLDKAFLIFAFITDFTMEFGKKKKAEDDTPVAEPDTTSPNLQNLEGIVLGVITSRYQDTGKWTMIDEEYVALKHALEVKKTLTEDLIAPEIMALYMEIQFQKQAVSVDKTADN